MATYMLDTNICIYIKKNKPLEVLEKFRTLSIGEAVISQIPVAFSLYTGFYKHRTATLPK